MMPGFRDFVARAQGGGEKHILAAALAIAATGQPVFACCAEKRPITRHGFKDASCDPAELRRQFASPAAVMIGMPTGRETFVVDCDVKNGAKGGEWLHENRERLVTTRTIRTASGGLHLYFQAPQGRIIRNSASKIAAGVDIRGAGGYVIVPPSPGYAVADDTTPAEAPAWLLDAMDPPPPVHAPRPPIARISHAGGTAYGLAALDDECDAIRRAPDGTKHHTINKAAYSIGGLVSGGELEEAQAFAALADALADLLPRCQDKRKAQRTLRDSFRDGMDRPRDLPEPPPPLPEHAEAVEHMLANLRVKQAKGRAAPLPVAPSLMDVPGALRAFLDHCAATAVSPQPFLDLAAGIAMIGAVAGRRYRTTTDLRTNIYTVGVADSGGGKDHARKQARRCMHAAGLSAYLGGSDIASGPAIRTALSRHPAILFQIDEFGDWLRDVLGEKSPMHRRQIATMFKELYSSASVPWQGVEYADQSRAGRPREDIHDPHACLYGTTTPAQFWGAVEGASLHDGLMARMLIFVSPCSYPDEREPELAEPPEALLDALKAIAGGVPGQGGNLSAVMTSSAAADPHTVPETPAATAARQAMRKAQLEQQRRAEGTYGTAIAARLAENAMKLALLRAVCGNPAAPVIGEADVAWGRALAQHCVDTLLREAEQHVADNDYGRKVNRLLSLIRTHGPLTERDMIRMGWRLPERDRTELLRTVTSGGLAEAIVVPPGPKGGRATIRYAIATKDHAYTTSAKDGFDGS